jgi:hypothetical protein
VTFTNASYASRSGRPPAALVHEVSIARRDEVLRCERLAIEHELLELGVRGVEQRAARRLVHTTRLHADHAILDEVDAADAMLAADGVELGHERERVRASRRSPTRRALLEADDDVFCDVRAPATAPS